MNSFNSKITNAESYAGFNLIEVEQLFFSFLVAASKQLFNQFASGKFNGGPLLLRGDLLRMAVVVTFAGVVVLTSGVE